MKWRNFMNLDDFNAFSQLDTLDMLRQIDGLPDQLASAWQLGRQQPLPAWTGIERVIIAGIDLAEPFVESLNKGLMLLDRDGLSCFVSTGIKKHQNKPELGKRFLALESKLGADTCLELRRIVPLVSVRQRLSRYLQARTGLHISIRALSDFPDKAFGPGMRKPAVVSDGRTIYLPDEIGNSSSWEENAACYRMLVQLEAGYVEFRTFDFDFEKVLKRCGDKKLLSCEMDEELKRPKGRPNLSDMELFFRLFSSPSLAKLLFTVFEHGRLQVLLNRFYPNMMKNVVPLLRRELREMRNGKPGEAMLRNLYSAVVLREKGGEPPDRDSQALIEKTEDFFSERIQEDESVETVAEIVLGSYPEIAAFLQKRLDKNYGSCSAAIPFDRILRPELYFSVFEKYEEAAGQIQSILDTKGIHVYRSDIRRHLREQGGKISPDTIRNLILESGNPEYPSEIDFQKAFSEQNFRDFSEIPGWQKDVPLPDASGPFSVYRYREWDDTLGDYLQDHVLVREKMISGRDEGFYEDAMNLYRNLIRKIQMSFELLKPEGLMILRKWLEGDEFDYRAMIDFVIEKKAGILPSDRLYIKRIKKNRDVSVLLLVDLSRSTSNTASGTNKTVLMIEKESIVLLCEALKVVGDSFSIAGFSGTGRLGVDYYTIKGFEENMTRDVIQRINGMMPLRSTRLGAAIRHAAFHLDKIPSKVRLLLILSDGFPNDTGYKRRYAMEDTRRALLEARSKNIYAHSILVNIAGDSRLDTLYGKIHHTVISDVCDLPDKLLRIYRDLTR